MGLLHRNQEDYSDRDRDGAVGLLHRSQEDYSDRGRDGSVGLLYWSQEDYSERWSCGTVVLEQEEFLKEAEMDLWDCCTGAKRIILTGGAVELLYWS